MTEVHTLNLSNGLQYPYQVIHSKRAKYIRIKLSRKGELSVTLPVFNKVKLAHEFIQSKRNWVETNLQKVNYLEKDALPTTLNLRLLAEQWSVTYKEIVETNNKTEQPLLINLKLTEKTESILELRGDSSQVTNSIVVTKRLNQWCRKKSEDRFQRDVARIGRTSWFSLSRFKYSCPKNTMGQLFSAKEYQPEL